MEGACRVYNSTLQLHRQQDHQCTILYYIILL